VVQLFANACFPLKAVEEDGISFHIRVRNLQGYLVVVAHVGGAKDRGHSASRNRLFNAVEIDLRTGFNRVQKAHCAACSIRPTDSTVSGTAPVSVRNP